MKAGFRDLAWGQALPDTLLPFAGDLPTAHLRRYIRPDDDLLLAQVTVSQITYLFAKSQFCGAEISFPSSKWHQLKDALIGLWGAPQPCDPGAAPPCPSWANRVTGAGGTFAAYSQNDNRGTLLIGNPDLLKQAERATREAEAGL